jgi:hypothetical protein
MTGLPLSMGGFTRVLFLVQRQAFNTVFQQSPASPFASEASRSNLQHANITSNIAHNINAIHRLFSQQHQHITRTATHSPIAIATTCANKLQFFSATSLFNIDRHRNYLLLQPSLQQQNPFAIITDHHSSNHPL